MSFRKKTTPAMRCLVLALSVCAFGIGYMKDARPSPATFPISEMMAAPIHVHNEFEGVRDFWVNASELQKVTMNVGDVLHCNDDGCFKTDGACLKRASAAGLIAEQPGKQVVERWNGNGDGWRLGYIIVTVR